MKGSWSSLCFCVVVLPLVCRAELSLQLLLDKSFGSFYSSTYLNPAVSGLTNLSLLSVPSEFAWLDPVTTARNFTLINLTTLPRGRRGAIELPFQSVLLPNWRLWHSPMECVANNTINKDCWEQLNVRSLQKSKFSFFYTMDGFLSLDSDAPFSLARERVEVDTDSSCRERSRIPYDGCSDNCPCNCSYGVFLPPGLFLRRFRVIESTSRSETPLLINWTGPLYSDAMNSSLPLEGIAFRYVDSFYLSNDDNPSAFLWVAETECIVPASSSDAALYQTICERFNFTAQVEFYTNGSHTYRFLRIPQDGFFLTPTLRISLLLAGLYASIGGTVPSLAQLQFDLPQLFNVSNDAIGSFLVPHALSDILERGRPNAALGFLAVRFELSLIDDYCSDLSLKVVADQSDASMPNMRQQLCSSCVANPSCWWLAAAGGGQGTCLSVMSSAAFSNNPEATRIALRATDCNDFGGKALELSDAYRLNVRELTADLHQQLHSPIFRTDGAELIPSGSMFSYRFNDTSFSSYRQLQFVFTDFLGMSIQYKANPRGVLSEIYSNPTFDLPIESFCGQLTLSAQIVFQERQCTAPSYCALTSDLNVAPWRQCNCTIVAFTGMVLSPSAVNATLWVEHYHESGVVGLHWSATAHPLNRLANWQESVFRGFIVNSSVADGQRRLHFDNTRIDIPPVLLLMANQSVYLVPSVWCPPCYFGSCNEVLLVCECDDGWSGEMCSNPETGLTAQLVVVNSSVQSTLMEALQCSGGGFSVFSSGCDCQWAATGPRCEYRCNATEAYFWSICVSVADSASYCRCGGRRVVTAPVAWYCINADTGPCVEEIEWTRANNPTIDATVDGLVSWNATTFVTALASANRTSLVWEVVLGCTYDALLELLRNDASSSRVPQNDSGKLSFTWLAALMALVIVIVAISVGFQCRFVHGEGEARGDVEDGHCDVQDQLHLILNGPSKM